MLEEAEKLQNERKSAALKMLNEVETLLKEKQVVRYKLVSL